MSYNGSGTFSPFTPGNPVITGTTISSTAFNATIQDIASGLSNAVTRDGQSPLTANLPAAGRKLTGLGAGVVAGDSLRFEQLFSQGTEQDIASAATTDIGGLNTTIARITGTTTITSFGTNYNGPRFVRFAGALLLTHNASTLILPGGANITTAAGDRAILTPVGSPASGWQVLAYEVAALAPGAATTAGTLSGTVAIANGGTGSTTAAAARLALGVAPGIPPISASVASNALTVTINPITLDFRSTTLGDGAVTTVSLTSAVSCVVPNGATLGSANAVKTNLAVLAINNAGTIEVAVVPLSGGIDISEDGLLTTTALSAASDVDNVAYSTTARTNVAYRIVGFIEYTQATAGVYATAPSLVGGKGDPLAKWMSGYGQTWQTVTRNPSVTYTNSTGRPIHFVAIGITSAATVLVMTVGSYSFTQITQSAGGVFSVLADYEIPAGSTYSYAISNGSATSAELR